MTFSYGIVGDVQPPLQNMYDTDYETLQNAIFDAQIQLSKIRYKRRMKPHPKHWESFLDWVQTSEAP